MYRNFLNRIYVLNSNNVHNRRDVLLKFNMLFGVANSSSSSSSSSSTVQWHTEGGGLGCSNRPRNSEDIGGVLDRTSKKNRRLDFLLYFTVFSYGCNLSNKGFF